VLGVRADFYVRCRAYASLVAALRDRQVLIGPMTQEELHSVVSSPAVKAGMRVESTLVAAPVGDA
jgi:hypothetical protein